MGGIMTVPTRPCDNQGPSAAITVSENVIERLTAKNDGAATEVALAAQDDNWRLRMRDVEETYSCRRGLSMEVFQRVAAHAEKLYAHTAFSPACHLASLRQQILTCYEKHDGSSLLCSELVKKFNKCVDASKPNGDGK